VQSRTTFDFDCEYLWKASRNIDRRSTALLRAIHPVLNTQKIGELWSTNKHKKIRANAHETCESLWQFLSASNLALSPSILSQFTLLQPKIAKKSR